MNSFDDDFPPATASDLWFVKSFCIVDFIYSDAFSEVIIALPLLVIFSYAVY